MQTHNCTDLGNIEIVPVPKKPGSPRQATVKFGKPGCREHLAAFKVIGGTIPGIAQVEPGKCLSSVVVTMADKVTAKTAERLVNNLVSRATRRFDLAIKQQRALADGNFGFAVSSERTHAEDIGAMSFVSD